MESQQVATQSPDTSAPRATSESAVRAQAAKQTPHERLLSMGMRPVGRASEFSDEIHALMARTPLFSGLDIDETRKLGAFMYVYEAPAGITLITEGETGDFMMLLMTGMIDVLRRNRYNYPSRIAVAHAGHALGEMSMFDGEPRFASCVTLEYSRIAVLTRDALMLVLTDEPKLGNKILLKLVQLLSDRLRQTSAKLVSYLEAAREA
ncbi:cyclic nucleotide-binding domain-containing protein [Quisquiliibacterium transsilvanicum]|uniref:CRP-like cAMP-binding protein n=1 Tax=Quisquiliibacterium transsilvanicum TaxID=1549638 RepID=A0A7W8HHU2_9BURK|nr:cyclic nucleotide-binding domain-containing protein [Quisquiliibacterium transsilvanicum]MBB5271568.1 CRP-like cAMP-binding protein [Quisquiliibacterium transsilvanicum]